jgi:hypothetical protein
MHMPLTQAEVTHATPAPQPPLLLQVCTLLPEHCKAPGLHEPVQTPDTHAELMQVAVLPHCPLD